MGVVVAQVVVGALVSKVASAVVSNVATDLFGMSDKNANLLGGIAGIAAGVYAGGQVGQAANSANAAKTGADAVAGSDAASSATATPLDMSGDTLTATPMPDAPPTLSGGSPNSLMARGKPATDIWSGGNIAGSAESVAPGASLNTGVASSAPPSADVFAADNIAPSTSAAGGNLGSVPPPEEVPWYKSMWGNKTVQQMAGGAAMGSANAMLQANALEGQANQRRKQQLEDEQRYRKSWQNLNTPRLNTQMLSNPPPPAPYQPQPYTPQPYTPMPVMRRRGS